MHLNRLCKVGPDIYWCDNMPSTSGEYQYIDFLMNVTLDSDYYIGVAFRNSGRNSAVNLYIDSQVIGKFQIPISDDGKLTFITLCFRCFLTVIAPLFLWFIETYASEFFPTSIPLQYGTVISSITLVSSLYHEIHCSYSHTHISIC